tara:strand:+ start:536 stop:724 length:189 start_codon:yes stop_codon:yes gene_type:complete
LPRASGLEVELKSKFSGIETKLISSGGGVYEITLDGELIFSKKGLERFPDDGEVIALIEQTI